VGEVVGNVQIEKRWAHWRATRADGELKELLSWVAEGRRIFWFWKGLIRGLLFPMETLKKSAICVLATVRDGVGKNRSSYRAKTCGCAALLLPSRSRVVFGWNIVLLPD